MRLSILGMGLAAPLGGIPELEAILNGHRSAPAGQTDTCGLDSYVPARKLRRIDHFTKMTLLAAYRALENANRLETLPNLGIVMSTGYGPAQTTFDFLDTIIMDGAHLASPLAFSHSVHSVPAGVLSLLLNFPCPQTTLCQLCSPTVSGLRTAALWLGENRADVILFGVTDERTPLLEENLSKIRRDSGEDTPEVGEGSAFFLLGREGTGKTSVEFDIPTDLGKAVNLARVMGTIPVLSGFELAAAALQAKTDGVAYCREDDYWMRVAENGHD